MVKSKLLSNMAIIKSPLRYPGGKSKALKKIRPFIPQDVYEYREPFLGGGSVFIDFKQKNPNTLCKINDLNSDVFCFWITLKKKPLDLINAITRIKESYTDGKSLYTKLTKSKTKGIFARALRYYVLNRITYSGIVDSGGYSSESFEKRFTVSKIDALLPLAKLLKNVKITNESYETSLFDEGENVFIFLDPPYWNTKEYPLYGKNGDMNRFFDHEIFAENVKKCKHNWLITCDNSELIRNLFSFANVYPWELKYNGLNKKTATNGKELFITNYEPQDLPF
jgi:DNA adenine methylase